MLLLRGRSGSSKRRGLISARLATQRLIFGLPLHLATLIISQVGVRRNGGSPRCEVRRLRGQNRRPGR